MFLRLVYQSFHRQRRSKLLAGIAVALGVAVATAMVAVATDIGDKLNRELRAFGANIIVRPVEDTLTVRVGGMILGVFEETDFEQVEIDLEPGDSLVLLTDGLIEAPESGGKRPGLPRVLDALVRARELTAQRQAESLTADVLERGTAQVHDDMTTFILKRP